MADSETPLVEQLVTANRILANENIVDAFGHVSVRSGHHPDEFLLSCSRSPQMVRSADIMRYKLDGTPVTMSSLRPYAERIIHGAIYEARPDVRAVCHAHSTGTLPFAASGEPIRPVIHVGTLFWDGVGWFDKYDSSGNLLVSTSNEGTALAQALGTRRAVLLQNHGCAVVGGNLSEAVMAAIYLDQNARVQLEARRMERTLFIEDEQQAQRAAKVFLSPLAQERAWEYWLGRLPQGWRLTAGLIDRRGTGN
jgi:ribulose-5-phosphate 4-epimerase/fuculose-1-phosphate aldolase